MPEQAIGESHNINDQLTFKLTERGREILAAKFASEMKAVPDEVKSSIYEIASHAVAEDGTVIMSVWEMLHTFGPHSYHGAPQAIEDNRFTFLKPAE